MNELTILISSVITMSLLSATLLLFLVLDPFGNIPLFIALLDRIEPARRRRVLARELLVALAVLLIFLGAGRHLLLLLGISQESLSIAGGIILFLIALKMIFGSPEELFRGDTDGEPFIVPLAVPLIAGPSALTTVVLMVARRPDRWAVWLSALLIAWLVSTGILFSSQPIGRLLGHKGVSAVQRLMGMLLTAIAVEMFLKGISRFLAA